MTDQQMTLAEQVKAYIKAEAAAQGFAYTDISVEEDHKYLSVVIRFPMGDRIAGFCIEGPLDEYLSGERQPTKLAALAIRRAKQYIEQHGEPK